MTDTQGFRGRIVDAWIQHPNATFLADPVFDSLRRWYGDLADSDLPPEWTIAALDEAVWLTGPSGVLRRYSRCKQPPYARIQSPRWAARWEPELNSPGHGRSAERRCMAVHQELSEQDQCRHC